MVLRARRVESEVRFYFKHRFDTGECSGTRGMSPAAICAAKFAHTKESQLHKRLKALVVESLQADAAFSEVAAEKHWKDLDGVRWRQPDVQAIHGGHRLAMEVQLATTFLHIIAQRMTFYRRNDGRLLWLFRDLDVGAFRLAEDDIFYANNRNAFRITDETLERSRATGRFALECVWMNPTTMGVAEVDTTRKIVFFDELTFDIGPSGAPRAYYFDYDAAVAQINAQMEEQGQRVADQALRTAMEQFVVAFDHDQTERSWQLLCERLRNRGFGLPTRFYGSGGPFYLLQAAYSAKLGIPVMCKHKNLLALANTLHQRHVGTLWVFFVLVAHYQRGQEFNRRRGYLWRDKLAGYWKDCLARSEAVRPDRSFDDLLAFLFPEAAEVLRASPARADVQRQVQDALARPTTALA